MKRYISAVLIPCFLLQLFGCYSYRDITLNELQKYNGPNNVRIKTNQDEIVINRKLTDENFMIWATGDSSIIINTIPLLRKNNDVTPTNRNYEIKYKQIKSIEIDEYNGLATVGLTVGIIVVGIFAIAAATFKIDIFPAGTKF